MAIAFASFKLFTGCLRVPIGKDVPDTPVTILIVTSLLKEAYCISTCSCKVAEDDAVIVAITLVEYSSGYAEAPLESTATRLPPVTLQIVGDPLSSNFNFAFNNVAVIPTRTPPPNSCLPVALITLS